MRIFGLLLLLLLVLTAVAWSIRPREQPGKTPLVWVSDDNPVRQAHIRLFNALHPECDLRLDPTGSDEEIMPKVIVQCSAGVGPDLYECYAPSQLQSYVKSGIALDITDELAKRGIDVKSEVWECALPLVQFNGRIYGFPANVATDALFFNKDVFDRMGEPYPTSHPWTWDEFLPLAQRMTVRDAEGRIKQYGFSFDPGMYKTFLEQWGARIYTEDGTAAAIDSPQAIAAMQFVQDLIFKYRVMPSALEEEAGAGAGGWGSATMKFIGSGKLATAMGGRWWLCTLRNYPGLRLGAVEMPHGPNRRFFSYGKATIINKYSRHKDDALKFLLHFTMPEYNKLINRQADGLAPMKKYCTDDLLIDPDHPDEDFHPAFRDAMNFGGPEQISPFVNAGLVERILFKQFDLLKRGKPAAEAMHTAADLINEEIRKSLAQDPALKEQYDAIIAKRQAAAQAMQRSAS
jgi:multiple sugar transport system substrate-binding protein